jgi:hypothetical protein
MFMRVPAAPRAPAKKSPRQDTGTSLIGTFMGRREFAKNCKIAGIFSNLHSRVARAWFAAFKMMWAGGGPATTMFFNERRAYFIAS